MTAGFKRRRAAWTTGVGIVLLGLLSTFPISMNRQGPLAVLICAQQDPQPFAWVCKKLLEHVTLTPNAVAQLNQENGALYPVLDDDAQSAEEMLELFLARGVNINAGNERAGRRTALHTMASEGNAPKIALLIEHGARVDVRDVNGHTPLDLAKTMQAKVPATADWPEIIDLLEAARVAQGATAPSSR